MKWTNEDKNSLKIDYKKLFKEELEKKYKRKISAINAYAKLLGLRKLKTTEDFVKIIEDRCKNKNYTFIQFCDENKNTSSKLTIQCNIDKHIWYPTYERFIYNNTNCPKCVNNIKKTKQEATEIITNKCLRKNYRFVKFIKGYDNAFSKIKLLCLIDSYEWTTSYNSFINNNTNCPKCKKVNKKTLKEVSKELNDICDKNQYKLLTNLKKEYKNVFSKIKLQCLKDDYIWETNYHSFCYENTRCPKCVGCAKITKNK